jgi:hypothetical protein
MTRLSRYRPVLSIVVRYLLGAALVYWFYSSKMIDFAVLGTLHLQVAVVATALVVLQLFLAGWRVQLLLAEHKIVVGILRCVSFNSVGIFYSIFLPGGMSGDLARAYCFWRKYPEASKSSLFGALFIDRLLGTVAMLFMGLIGGSFLVHTLGLSKFVLISWVIFTAFCLVYWGVTRLHHRVDKARGGAVARLFRFVEKIDVQGYGWRTLILGSVLSLAGHFCAVLIIFLFSQLVGSGLGLLKITAVAPLGLLANALPLTPGGLGIGEKGFELLYNAVGGQNGGNSFLLSRVFLFAPALLGVGVLIHQFVRAHRFLISGFKKA